MIKVSNLSKHYGPQTLFEDVSFTIGKGEKVGLVGRNGSGKTTLFRLIQGIENPDDGEIITLKNYRVGNLQQHISFSKNTVIQECCSVLTDEDVHETYRAEKILFGLGFIKEDMDKSPLVFSGGFQIRLHLAKLLLQKNDLLLLDEPTNYLDILSMRWLKRFLIAFEGEFILISHDREFMDTVTTHTMGFSRSKLKKIRGGTEKFYQQLLAEEEVYEQTRLNQERKKKELEEFVSRFKAKASKATQAQSRVKMLGKLSSMEELAHERMLGFKFNYRKCPGKTLLEISDLSFGYEENEILFKGLNFSIGREDRVGIIGKNGKGKSTLLNILAGELDGYNGTVKSHPEIKIGHLGQTNIQRLNPNNTIIDELSLCDASMANQSIRSICGAMMFEGDAAKKRISVLSGGERSRVMLGKILVNPTNLLLLDEPDNHLDMESIEALSREIDDYDGAAVFVTHSEMILKRLASRLIIFHKNGVELFDGGYDDFLEKIGWDDDSENDQTAEQSKPGKRELKRLRAEIISERSKIIGPLKKEIEELETKIMGLEEIVESSNLKLVEASNQGNGEMVVDLSRLIKESQKEVDLLFERLENASNKLSSYTEKFDVRLSDLGGLES